MNENLNLKNLYATFEQNLEVVDTVYKIVGNFIEDTSKISTPAKAVCTLQNMSYYKGALKNLITNLTTHITDIEFGKLPNMLEEPDNE